MLPLAQGAPWRKVTDLKRLQLQCDQLFPNRDPSRTPQVAAHDIYKLALQPG